MTPTIFHVDGLDLSFVPKPWAFAQEKRAEIDAYFAEVQRNKPAVWNGRVLLMHHQVVRDGVFRGEFLETDYASFVAWGHWGCPSAKIHNCFGAAALMSADRAFLLGLMGPHTFRAGSIYFPCGTPDPDDIRKGQIDFDFSVRRELAEETGLDPGTLTPEPGWNIVVDGALVAAIKVLRSPLGADHLRQTILANLGREQEPELADIRIVRGPADFDPAMPRFVTAFLEGRFHND
jgi:8-oxo-dGTP pyrophosphatase MutT (NUDIX family)